MKKLYVIALALLSARSCRRPLRGTLTGFYVYENALA